MGRAIGPALLLLALHYVWVLRSDTAFEAAAAEWALDRARRGPDRGLHRGAASPTLLPLAPTGRAGTALIWKNLAAVFRRRRVRNVALGYAAVALATGGASLAGAHGLAHAAGALALTWAAFALLLGPLWVRNDLRRDLRQLDLLKSYPLRGRTVIAAESAAATVLLSLMQFGLLAAAWLAFVGERGGDATLGERTALLIAAMVVLPLVNFMALLLQNGAALLYPAWMSAIGDGGGGIEALGQNLLATAGFTLCSRCCCCRPLPSAQCWRTEAGVARQRWRWAGWRCRSAGTGEHSTRPRTGVGVRRDRPDRAGDQIVMAGLVPGDAARRACSTARPRRATASSTSMRTPGQLWAVAALSRANATVTSSSAWRTSASASRGTGPAPLRRPLRSTVAWRWSSARCRPRSAWKRVRSLHR